MENAGDYHQILIDQAHLLSEASETLAEFIKNISGFFEEISEFLENKTRTQNEDLQEFQHHSNKLKQYIDQVHEEIPALTDVITKSEKELQACHAELTELKNELRFQKDENQESKKKYEDNLDALNHQSSYSVAMGSVLGTMLWKTSKSQEVIETFIEAGLLNQFLNISNNTLVAFRTTYKTELPIAESNEHKFIFAIFGIFINIVAQRVGRDFVLERENGVEFVKDSIKYLGEITTMPSGHLLKRLILMMLYNLSITKKGALLIQVAENGVESILKCQDVNHSTEIQLLSLTLMTTLLNELPTQEFCDKIINCVSQHDIKMLMKSSDENVKFHCIKFIEKLQEYGSGDTSMDD